MANDMTPSTAARAQVGLSYLFLLGFFALATAQGLGYLKIDLIGELKDVLMLMMTFWFMRQRTTDPAPAPAGPTAAPYSTQLAAPSDTSGSQGGVGP